jgi:hypothetical protein
MIAFIALAKELWTEFPLSPTCDYWSCEFRSSFSNLTCILGVWDEESERDFVG